MFRSIMNRIFRSKKPKPRITAQPPGEVFSCPANTQLKALDEFVLALPLALLEPDEEIGSVIQGDEDAEFCTDDERIYLRLKPGMIISVTKSCQAFISSDDPTPRRIEILSPHTPTDNGTTHSSSTQPKEDAESGSMLDEDNGQCVPETAQTKWGWIVLKFVCVFAGRYFTEATKITMSNRTHIPLSIIANC